MLGPKIWPTPSVPQPFHSYGNLNLTPEWPDTLEYLWKPALGWLMVCSEPVLLGGVWRAGGCWEM